MITIKLNRSEQAIILSLIGGHSLSLPNEAMIADATKLYDKIEKATLDEFESKKKSIFSIAHISESILPKK